MTLHSEAIATLRSWTAPDDDQEQLRCDFLDHLRANPDGVSRHCLPDHVTASSLVIDPQLRRVALLLHRKAGMWLPSGGHCEPGDLSLADAALREAREETGIDGLRLVDPTRPAALHRHAAPCRPGLAGNHLDVQYFTIAPADAPLTVSEETHDVRWFGYDSLPEPIGDDVPGLVELASAVCG